ncbi:MAG: methyl-accepting chemotaxis protein [Aquabacterium sp.]|nr:methyl-accepting chemotaxis protein [Aquabacterium sp.]
MTAPPSNSSPAAAAAPAGALRRLGGLRLGAAASVVLACALLGWAGGWAGMVGALVAASLLPLLLRAGVAASEASDSTLDPMLSEPRVSGGRVGAEVMVGQVVPVWSKQVEITRDAAADGLAKLLDTFSQISGALGDLADHLNSANPSVEVGALDAALDDASPARTALTALLGPSQRAFDQRDAAVAELVRCSQALGELRQLGRQAREIGKHTRLVAFNASIEANRGGQGGGNGSQAVANETRMLAARMGEIGEQIERAVAGLDRSLGAERLRGEIGDTTPEELRLELDVRAREALSALLGSLGTALRSSGEVRSSAEVLRNQLDEAFVHFQFGDRLSQMLAIVGSDMQNFARWVAAHPYATQSDAAEWLANLEGSYTMEEQRAQHHGNVHIDRGSEIEFF